ncbi:MAG: hypothetical protein ACOC30_01935 [Marinilabilia sp.]
MAFTRIGNTGSPRPRQVCLRERIRSAQRFPLSLWFISDPA